MRKIAYMQRTHSFGTRYLTWRSAPPDIAKRISGKFQTIMVTLWGLVTVSTGIMGHLDFDLAGQIDIHIRQTLLFLGLAAVVALLVPTHSHARWIVQTTAISFCGALAFLFAAAFTPA